MVGRCFLLIWDRVEHLEIGQKISIYFNVDEEKMYQGKQQGSYYSMNGKKANLYVQSLSGLSAELLDGFVSETMDTRHSSVRICYEDISNKKCKDYLTLLIPFERRIPEVKQSGIFYEKTVACMDIAVNGEKFQLRWDGEEFIIRKG